MAWEENTTTSGAVERDEEEEEEEMNRAGKRGKKRFEEARSWYVSKRERVRARTHVRI